MAYLLSTAGAVLVAVALRDLWVTLFRPTSQGTLSRLVTRSVWRTIRRTAAGRPDRLRHAGPLAVAATVAAWAGLLALGWALVFWAWMPGAFSADPALGPAPKDDFLDALYLSLVTLSTLGYGDITPTTVGLRMLAPFEAAIGFVLLTATISWVLSVYPALTRQRTLAHRITLTQEAAAETGTKFPGPGPDAAAQSLARFTAQVVAIRSDFLQFPVTYYFYDDDERSALPTALPYLLDLAETGCALDAPEVRLRATELRGALEDLATVLRARCVAVESSDTRTVLTAYAADHLHHVLHDGDAH